jgi:Regulator of chromosome condensation (RCC1) repeat
MALTELGVMYTFGNGKDGKLGYEESKNVLIPRKIENCPKFQRKFGATDDRNKRFPLFTEYDDTFNLISKSDTSAPTEVL